MRDTTIRELDTIVSFRSALVSLFFGFERSDNSTRSLVVNGQHSYSSGTSPLALSIDSHRELSDSEACSEQSVTQPANATSKQPGNISDKSLTNESRIRSVAAVYSN